jgi:hypothetical protein
MQLREEPLLVITIYDIFVQRRMPPTATTEAAATGFSYSLYFASS